MNAQLNNQVSSFFKKGEHRRMAKLFQVFCPSEKGKSMERCKNAIRTFYMSNFHIQLNNEIDNIIYQHLMKL